MDTDGPEKDAPPTSEPDPVRGVGPAFRDQEGLWREVLGMAAEVEVALKSGVQALCEGRLDLVEQVRAEEQAIDRWEVRIETECLRVLALYALVASDLRRVVAALRINRDLEGLADLAENLAKRARKLTSDPAAAPFLPRLCLLAQEAVGVVDLGLSALRVIDADLARRVIEADRAVDGQRAALLTDLKDAVRAQPERVNTWLRLISSARNLERAADHATNIAEAVVYMKEGVTLRRGDGDGDD
jgi:phosphate transport system protein